jgi:hypothetical protein
MSLERPELPSGADSPEELVAHVTNNPSDWLMYLRYINGYAAALKKENDLFRIAESDYNATLQPFRSIVAKQEGIIEYQKTQYKENTTLLRKKIAQLKIEKARLLDAAIPAVQIPRFAPADTPNTPAEQPANLAWRPIALAFSIHSGFFYFNKKIPNLNEFDGFRNDFRRFTQQIYGKMTANADRFPTAIARLTYVAERLTGKIYELILPKTRFEVPEFLDYSEMLAYLENAFENPDRVQNA